MLILRHISRIKIVGHSSGLMSLSSFVLKYLLLNDITKDVLIF